MALVNEAWDHMSIFQIVVIVGTKDVGRNDASKVVTKLFIISPAFDINHALGIGITKVGIMWWSIVDHGFIDRIAGFVGEDTGGETRQQLLDLEIVRALDDIVVDEHIVAKHICLELHVLKETTDRSSQMKHMSWLVFLEYLFGVVHVSIQGSVL